MSPTLLYGRATVFYQRTAQAEQAYTLADALRGAGIEVDVRSGVDQNVVLYGRFTRDVQFLSWEEARGLTKMQHDGPVLKVKRLTQTAKLPTRGSPKAAGLDVYYDGETTVRLNPGDRALLSTGLSITAPEGTYARVAPRSGLGVKGIGVLAGVVDEDYTGEVKVILTHHGKQADVFGAPFFGETVEIKPGDRIAQIILEQCLIVPVVEVDSLDDTERGAGGFGSTGA
ncbi:putative dUTP pyrophosphatase [Caulobacter virus Magneto]|uniref:putative dUTP pyrophosphatase n=1 Tax=Caulobacter virus Magneto TaxID=1211642 RepID=UPI00028AA562|nr:putative dUTP pyrophosphatase [Caulobacter virus Magneto]AFU87277.1 putative dUTP pyrophosphatase [Caulobacter virus Magneto]